MIQILKNNNFEEIFWLNIWKWLLIETYYQCTYNIIKILVKFPDCIIILKEIILFNFILYLFSIWYFHKKIFVNYSSLCLCVL